MTQADPLAPDLILQMQRMGDLILTFPLLGYLQAKENLRPLWVVAEPKFFNELLRLAPKATFFPPEAAPQLQGTSYRHIINLSHRADAAQLCGSLHCQQRVGPYTLQDATYVQGFWQLYRSSIVHNNRHNLFHWADLNLLSCMDSLTQLPCVCHPLPASPGTGCVGIFIGASEVQKRPSPQFWAQVAKGLLRKGLKPVFLGGPEDVELGAEAQAVSGIAGSNLCGRFPLAELATLLRTLDLFICADTGPMHLASWVGTPVLNVSMGHVNAWETGPASPGHYVLQSTSSCVGCWQCTRNQLACHQNFQPSRVVLTAHTIIHAPENLKKLALPRLRLLQTGRDERGLYTLTPVAQQEKAKAQRHTLARFWQEWFIHLHSGTVLKDTEYAAALLRPLLPTLLHAPLKRHTVAFSREISRHMRAAAQHTGNTKRGAQMLPENFWQNTPPLLRPLTGFLQMSLQNDEYKAEAWDYALTSLAAFAQITEKDIS